MCFEQRQKLSESQLDGRHRHDDDDLHRRHEPVGRAQQTDEDRQEAKCQGRSGELDKLGPAQNGP
ncbi:hypothetical protein PH31N_10998 [Cutibacterium modestum 31N]|nr:hypothetical protein [Cutibacterium modestum 31N]